MKKTELRRKSWMKRGTKQLRGRRDAAGKMPLRRNSSLKKVNVARQAKRRERYRKGLAAYRKSECYKIVTRRASGRCEHVAEIRPIRGGLWRLRCYAIRPGLTHHHLTYARFGGQELPEDIIVLCKAHNREAEAKHSTRQRNYRRSA